MPTVELGLLAHWSQPRPSRRGPLARATPRVCAPPSTGAPSGATGTPATLSTTALLHGCGFPKSTPFLQNLRCRAAAQEGRTVEAAALCASGGCHGSSDHQRRGATVLWRGAPRRPQRRAPRVAQMHELSNQACIRGGRGAAPTLRPPRAWRNRLFEVLRRSRRRHQPARGRHCLLLEVPRRVYRRHRPPARAWAPRRRSGEGGKRPPTSAMRDTIWRQGARRSLHFRCPARWQQRLLHPFVFFLLRLPLPLLLFPFLFLPLPRAQRRNPRARTRSRPTRRHKGGTLRVVPQVAASAHPRGARGASLRQRRQAL
mmetsp:Transcript_83008/g.231693  ORF Transcript_83008/g.231693 Transcript_83008/m.231693 type:complete len:314 (-) Transcript_83008:3317-4258(-)